MKINTFWWVHLRESKRLFSNKKHDMTFDTWKFKKGYTQTCRAKIATKILEFVGPKSIIINKKKDSHSCPFSCDCWFNSNLILGGPVWLHDLIRKVAEVLIFLCFLCCLAILVLVFVCLWFSLVCELFKMTKR